MPFTYSAGTTTPNLAGLAEFNGVRINDGTFELHRLGGVIDSSPVRTSVTPLPSDFGSYVGASFADALPISIEGRLIVADYTQVGAALDKLRGAFNVAAGVQTLRLNYPGWATARQVSAFVAGPITVDEPPELEKLIPERNFVIPMIAADPFLYDGDNLRTATLAMPSGTASVTNAGTTPAPFVARFTGPFTGPVTLTCTTNSQVIVYSGNAIAGAYLDVTTNPVTGITVVSNAGVNYYFQLGTMSAFTIPVGTSSWAVSGATGTTGASQVTLTWRDTWS